MSSYDPRQLKSLLEDVQDYLQIWSSVARDTLEQADYWQRLRKEYVDRARHQASIVKNRAQEDDHLVKTKKSQYDAVAVQCIEAASAAQETLNRCQEASNDAQHSHFIWQSELEKALAWLERALNRLAAAERQYELAKSNLERAERNVDRARRNYNRCRNDPERKDCRGEIRALEGAQSDLIDAQRQLVLAIEELKAAQLEVQQARARVECCKRAVQFAEQAVKLAQSNLDIAQQGEKSASISLELSDIVQKSADQAEIGANKQIEVAEAIMAIVRESSSLTEEAQRYLVEADHLHEATQGYAFNANSEITNRIEGLIELNRPVAELGGGARRNIGQGEIVEREAKQYLKREMKLHRSGLGLHYGRQGIDVYGIRNTPKGKSLLRVESKSTRIPSKHGTESEILRSLDIDKKGIQQASPLYGADRLEQAIAKGSRVAKNIRMGQAHAGQGRIWQSRDYIYWANVTTGERKFFRVIPTSNRKYVHGLKLIESWRE